ncbi:putative alpha-glucosidase [Helianthus annuus]|nr:putative alpha-glucosidase [Helianthus annuus]
MEFGEVGGKWTFVRFSSHVVGNKATLRSVVQNDDFAISQKWRVEKVTFIGLEDTSSKTGFAQWTSARGEIHDGRVKVGWWWGVWDGGDLGFVDIDRGRV